MRCRCCTRRRYSRRPCSTTSLVCDSLPADEAARSWRCHARRLVPAHDTISLLTPHHSWGLVVRAGEFMGFYSISDSLSWLLKGATATPTALRPLVPLLTLLSAFADHALRAVLLSAHHHLPNLLPRSVPPASRPLPQHRRSHVPLPPVAGRPIGQADEVRPGLLRRCVLQRRCRRFRRSQHSRGASRIIALPQD